MKNDRIIRIRPLEERDLEKIVCWNNDPEVGQFMDGPQPRTLEEGREWYRDCCRTKSYRLFALENECGVVLGELELDQIVWRRGEAELRICIGEKEYWNQGYGQAGVENLLKLAFYQLNLKKIYLRVYLFNQRAIRCYERVGFRQQACLRRKEDQNWKPLLLMDIDRERFISMQKKQGLIQKVI